MVSSFIYPPCDASWLLECWEGSVLAATVVEVVGMVGLVMVQVPSMAVVHSPLLLLLLYLRLLQIMGLPLALSMRRGKPPSDDHAGSSYSTRLPLQVVALVQVVDHLVRRVGGQFVLLVEELVVWGRL